MFNYIGTPLVFVKSVLRGEDLISNSCQDIEKSHQESRSPINNLHKNKCYTFNRNVGFVSKNTLSVDLPCASPIDMSDHNQYLAVVEAVLQSGVPNYKGARVPLSSTFNLQYLKEMIVDYHDKKLIDYLTFGFPLGLVEGACIKSNAKDNHASALNFPEAVDEYIAAEKREGTLLGPFQVIPHEQFTWSPLMTCPKGLGRRVIVDLSFGDYSVNNATNTQVYDATPFHLKLPVLDGLIPDLERLGSEARLFKVDISRAFRNIRMDPGDAIRLGIKWNNEYFLDQNLPFGAVHGTAIFERITDLIRYIMGCKGCAVWNYIDDMYACCHKDVAEKAFSDLLETIRSLGLPINDKKVFPPAKRMTIMGIVIDVTTGTFSIENEKLLQISSECAQVFLRDVISKLELQSLLGKLLYISRCVRGSRIFMNRLLDNLRAHHDRKWIYPDEGFYQDLSWFLRFLQTFNGIVRFHKQPVTYVAHVEATLTNIGGAWGDRVYSTRIPEHLVHAHSITQYEMYNVVIALKVWANDWENKTVCVYCDNESTVTVCNKGATRDPFLNKCLHEIWLVAAVHNITLRVAHIPVKLNGVADALSRNTFQQSKDTIWEQVPLQYLMFLF